MGSLTESMTRLCGEILAQRGARLTYIEDLGQNVADLKANLRRAPSRHGPANQGGTSGLRQGPWTTKWRA